MGLCVLELELRKGRRVIPREIRERLDIREEDEVLVMVEADRIIIRKMQDPFRVLEELLGDLAFDRKLCVEAEKEALREIAS